MKAILAALIGLLCFVFVSDAQVHVRGYTKKDGTYVAPHYRSSPDHNFYNNYSTKGNVNPYTGKEGTRVTPPATYHYTPNIVSTPTYVPTVPAPTYVPTVRAVPAVTVPTYTPSLPLERPTVPSVR